MLPCRCCLRLVRYEYEYTVEQLSVRSTVWLSARLQHFMRSQLMAELDGVRECYFTCAPALAVRRLPSTADQARGLLDTRLPYLPVLIVGGSREVVPKA